VQSELGKGAVFVVLLPLEHRRGNNLVKTTEEWM